jgi:hypothetical protein
MSTFVPKLPQRISQQRPRNIYERAWFDLRLGKPSDQSIPKGVGKTMSNADITFCNTTDNECPKRLKCYRYVAEHGKDEYVWYGEFWLLYGRGCKEFIPVRNDNDTGKQIRQG